MSRETNERLSTADLAGADTHVTERPPVGQQQVRQDMRPQPAPTREGQVRDAQMQEAQMREGQMRDPAMRDAQVREPHQMQSAEAQARNAQVRHAEGAPAAAGAAGQMEQLAALFPPHVAAEFRNHWDQVQIGFVDDPRRAVQQADELVAQVMKSLATSFAEQRARLEAGLGKGEEVNTENLRMALRGYRSFFQRLLSL
jgi:non-ribosomal peptide synthetase component F